MVKSAVCLLAAHQGKFLAISRRNDTTQWGIVGGKVDRGEANIQALLREVSEEVGLSLDPTLLEPLVSALCPGDVTFWVTTYMYKGGFKLEDLIPEEGFEVRLLSREDLTNSAMSPFADYNEHVFAALDAYLG